MNEHSLTAWSWCRPCLKEIGCTLKTLALNLNAKSRLPGVGDEAAQKVTLVDELDAERVVVLGNGANDALMLRQAALGIAVLSGEGLATACLTAGVIAPDIVTALDLLLFPRRLIATLRT